MPRTFLETFRCSNSDVLAASVNKHAERKGLEILSISVNVDEKARYRYEAIVLFEKPIEVSKAAPPIVERPPIKP
ncbi:hypothetical protein [Acinetobacter variabilis]|uniref:hypothetical protein n=1 Tax=Acinetobacter variabilis TaxID=70346 RepID=UPI001BB6211B|nr:hypothetical protein [Acinetobacter variabilis]BCT88159.1 hypothetical protein RYU24_05640 [Acinetobacter variabilis]